MNRIALNHEREIESADQWFLGRRHLPAHVQGRTVCAPVRLPPLDMGGGVLACPGDVREFWRVLADRAANRESHEGPRGMTVSRHRSQEL